MPCNRSIGGVVSQHALQVSRSTPKGEVEGDLARGVSRPTPKGKVEGDLARGVCRPTPGGCLLQGVPAPGGACPGGVPALGGACSGCACLGVPGQWGLQALTWGCLLQGVPAPGGACSRGCLLQGVPAPGGACLGVPAWGCLLWGMVCRELPLDGHCCRQYASYWNAFLFSDKFQFHFVFLIQLRYVDKKSSLAQIIKSQHNLRKVNTKYIESILEGETNHKVLLLLDGYDEYKRGANKDIDEEIESKIGNCFLILTSRPGNDSGDRMFVSKKVRDRMDGEIVIEGFSPENIEKCSIQYLLSEENCQIFLAQAEETELSSLLHVPIILLMSCTVFISNMSLPHSKTKLYGDIFDLIMDRTTLKTYGCKSSDIPHIAQLLSILGKLSWEALQKDTGQLLLNKVNFN